MLATIVEARDTDAGMHLQRIREYCQVIAARLGLPRQLAQEIGYAAMIHDVGKAHVPDAILALTSRRPYKDAWPSGPAMAEMAAQRGRHFDPKVLDVFAALWEEGVIEDIRRRFQDNDDICLPRVA